MIKTFSILSQISLTFPFSKCGHVVLNPLLKYDSSTDQMLGLWTQHNWCVLVINSLRTYSSLHMGKDPREQRDFERSQGHSSRADEKAMSVYFEIPIKFVWAFQFIFVHFEVSRIIAMICLPIEAYIQPRIPGG